MANAEIQRRKQRWLDYYEGKPSARRLFVVRFEDDKDPRPPLWPGKKAERVEWAWRTYQRRMEQVEWLKDDRMVFFELATGTEIFAEAFGCRVHYPDDNLPFALPMINKASEVRRIKVPHWSSTPLTLLFEMADELQRRGGKEALFRIPDIQSPMDIAALIWNKNEFYLGFIDAPEAVKELAEKARQLLVSFVDAWQSRYGREFVAHCPENYMPQGISVSEDEVGIVNEEMFLEFFLPELVELSNRFGGISVHCCADSRHQWANFKKIPNLRLLNLYPPAPIKEAVSCLAEHTAQMHGWNLEGPIWTWPGQVSANARCVFDTSAKTGEEALETLERINALS